MSEKLLKRYLLEKKYNDGLIDQIQETSELYFSNILFEKLKKGEIEFDENDFNNWLINLKRNKVSFGMYIKSLGYLEDKEKVFEITDDYSVSSINDIKTDAKKTILIAQSGEGCLNKPLNTKIDGHLVINGVYDNQLIYLSRLLRNPNSSFTVGYYGKLNCEYTRRVIEYYKNLRQFLKKMIPDSTIDIISDEMFNGDKFYSLTYNPLYNLKSTSKSNGIARR